MGGAGAGAQRVAVVSHGFFPSVGGSERYHLFTARALAREVDVRVFTSALNLDPTRSRAPAASTARVGPLTVQYLASRWFGTERLVRARSLWAALRTFRPDLVWSNHPSPTADLAALYAIAARRPWLATYHADVSTNRWSHRVYLRGEMVLLRRASAVLVTSDAYRRILIGRGVRAERIRVVPTGPYIGDGSPPAAAHAGGGADPTAPFLFVGALDPGHAYKRLDLLIDAVAELAKTHPTVALEVVGDGSRRPDYETQARTQGVSERVRFLGVLPDPDLAERYARARATVLPAVTVAEGFGTVAVEALHYGCPVVVSDQGPLAGTLTSEGAGLAFAAHRPGALAATLQSLLEDASLRARLAAGAARLAPRYEWSSLLPQMVAPARELLGLRGAGPVAA